jgi:hypothetical protein
MIKDKKGRNIFNPTPTGKYVAGWMNFNMIRVSKIVNPSFIHGMNT